MRQHIYSRDSKCLNTKKTKNTSALSRRRPRETTTKKKKRKTRRRRGCTQRRISTRLENVEEKVVDGLGAAAEDGAEEHVFEDLGREALGVGDEQEQAAEATCRIVVDLVVVQERVENVFLDGVDFGLFAQFLGVCWSERDGRSRKKLKAKRVESTTNLI
jgi:hypothetical protein